MAKRSGYTDICHRCKQGVPRRSKNCPHCGVDLERLTLASMLLRTLLLLCVVLIFAITIWVFYWALSGSDTLSSLPSVQPASTRFALVMMASRVPG